MSRATWGCEGLSVRYGPTVGCEDVTFEVAAGTVWPHDERTPGPGRDCPAGRGHGPAA